MKKFLKILLIFILLAVFAGGVYYFRFMKKNAPSLFMGTSLKAPNIDIYPNYGSIQQVINDAGITWAASYEGGLVRYDGAAKKVSFYNKSNGLLGNSVQSILKQGNKLWIAMQGSGIQILNTNTGKIEKTFDKGSYTQVGQVANGVFGNPRLFEDPYTGDIWVATINGAFKYNAVKFLWSDQSDLDGHSIWEMYFSKDAIWAGGKTNPGAYMFKRSGGGWIDLTHEPKFSLDQYLMNTAADETSFYAFYRPSNHNSCGDKNLAAMMQVYSPGVGWQNLDAVNRLIKIDEEAVELRYEKPYILAIGEENVCNHGDQAESTYYVIKYNVDTKEATREPYKESDIKNLNGRSQDGEVLQAKIEKETGIPAEKTLVYVGKDDKPLIQTGNYGYTPAPAFGFLDPVTGTYDFSLWDKIQKHKEVSESQLYFQVLNCNQYNNPMTEDKFFIKEFYMGEGPGPKEHIYAYSISKDTIEEVNIPDNDSNSRNIYDVFVCNDKEVMYPSIKGFISYSFASKKETLFSADYRGTNYCTIYNACFQEFDGTRKYFMSTNDRELGYFDASTLKYGYYKIPDTIGNLTLWKETATSAVKNFDPMVMNHATPGILYFVYKESESNSPTHIIIYDIKGDKWVDYPLTSDFQNGWNVDSIRPFNGEVWITTTGMTFIIDDSSANGNYRVFNSSNGTLDDTGKLFLASDRLWFQATDTNSGFWSYQPAK